MAPAGTPDAIVQKINRDLSSVLGQPELQEKLAKLGTYVQPMSVAGDRSVHQIRTEAVAADCEKTDGLAVTGRFPT